MSPSPKPSNWPLILIALAITGAGISYHFTLQSRFSAIEQKLDENALALQQYQIAQETIVSSKTEALTNLSHEVDDLEASLGPLGKATREQTDSLAEMRQQVASLGQLQHAQQAAEKRLADYAGQLEQIRHDVQMRAAAPPAATAPAPVQVPLIGPVPPPTLVPAPATHASAQPANPPPLPPRAEASAVDLRPADIAAPRENAVRALPVALPVDASLSVNR